MTSRADVPTITRRRSVLACARCRARRVKCDRAQPACSNCTKAGASCVPAQQSPTTSAQPSSSRAGRREPGDYNRLSKLEQEVARLSREVDSSSPSREVSITPSPDDVIEYSHDTRGQILSAPERRYFSPFSWAAVPEEVANIDALIAGDPASVSNLPTKDAPITQNASLSLPDDNLHETLLNIFRYRVDPLVRLLHWPSFLEQCQVFRQRTASPTEEPSSSQYPPTFFPSTHFDAAQQTMYPNPRIVPTQNPNSRTKWPDPAFVGLLYSVYYAAMVSVVHGPSPPDLGSNINPFSLMATFKGEVAKRVLALDGSVARSPSFQALQAMTLALSVEPETFDIQLKWLQLGAAVRSAQSLGVHRDGSKYDLTPIEIECRRRVWAHLCILDLRYAEQLGCEPTIVSDCYDTALPLSIDDRDLSDIEAQDAASRLGRETNFKAHHEVEYSQERQSPFSPMTFCLVEAESTRLLAQLLSLHHRSREGGSRGAGSTSGGQRARSSSRGPPENAYWARKLEHRFQAVYGLGKGELSNPLHYLVTEVAEMSIAKAKFITHMMDWKDKYSSMSGIEKDSEMLNLFQIAIRIATRSASLIHQYSHSPYRWYTRRFRDVYTSAFLAIGLATEQPLSDEYLSLASSVLGQLYPIDAATGDFLEPSLTKSAFGKLLLKARSAREFQLQMNDTEALHNQAMQAAARADQSMFSSNVAAQVASTFPTSNAGVGSFQSSGNLFEDFDAIMQDPLWTPDLGGTGSPYDPWSTATSPALSTHPSSRHPSQPSVPPQHYHQQPIPISSPYTTPVLNSHSPANSHTSSILAERMEQMPLPSFHVEHTSPVTRNAPTHVGMSANIKSANTSPDLGIMHLEPSRTWPLPQPESDLQVPSRAIRERSLSQPHHPYYLEIESPRVVRTKSMTMASSALSSVV